MTREAYAARAGRIDIMVAMNAETYPRTCASRFRRLPDFRLDLAASRFARGDITVFGVPLAEIVNENFDGVRNRILLKNIAYAGEPPR